MAVTDGDLTDLRGAAIAVSPSVALSLDWDVGSTRQIRIAGEAHEVRIAALLPGTVSGPYFLMSPDLVPAAAGPWQQIVRLADGADEGQVITRLQEFGRVTTVDQWVADTADAQDRATVNIMIVLLGTTMLYTAIAIINAVEIAAPAVDASSRQPA